jgi:hypothetical protein
VYPTPSKPRSPSDTTWKRTLALSSPGARRSRSRSAFHFASPTVSPLRLDGDLVGAHLREPPFFRRTVRGCAFGFGFSGFATTAGAGAVAGFAAAARARANGEAGAGVRGTNAA